MNQKQIGTILIIIGILLGIFVYSVQQQQNSYIQDYWAEKGTCFTDNGTCLHNQSNTTLYFGFGLALAILILGFYLVFFDKTQKILLKQHQEFSHALKESKEEDKFKAFLVGFSESEKKVLQQIKDQDGIKQSTLQIKTGISKAALSLILKDFEEKEYVSRKEDGKTKRVYLRKVL